MTGSLLPTSLSSKDTKPCKAIKYIVVFLAATMLVYVAYHAIVISFLIADVSSESKKLLYERTLNNNYKGEYSSFIEPVPFKAPWGKHVSTKVVDEAISYVFDSEVHLAFHYIGTPWYTDILKNRFTDAQTRYFQETFGWNLSDYEIRRIILSTTPADLSFFRSIKYNRTVHEILSLKEVSLMTTGDIYTFETPKLCGFQFCSPEKYNWVTLELYDGHSNMYLVQIHGDASQDEIDFFLNSLNANPDE